MKSLEKIFEYSGIQIRTQVIEQDFWFCLADLAKVLGIKNQTHFLKSEHCDQDGVRISYLIDDLGRKQEATFINEPNLYAMVLRSSKKEALEFRRWITHEVLPALRKTGRYAVDSVDNLLPASDDPILGMIGAVQAIRHHQIQDSERISKIEQRLNHLEKHPIVHEPTERLMALPAPEAQSGDLATRAQCIRVVELISGCTGVEFGNTWREAYRQYELKEHIKLEPRVKSSKSASKIEWIEKHGKIEVLYGILRRMHLDARSEKLRRAELEQKKAS